MAFSISASLSRAAPAVASAASPMRCPGGGRRLLLLAASAPVARARLSALPFSVSPQKEWNTPSTAAG
jgi:hypothetical protein